MEAVLRNINSADWITMILFSSVLFMVLAKYFFYSRFLNFIMLPFNNKYIFMYNKKDKLLNWFNIFFFSFLILNLSLFLFFINEVFFAPMEKYAWETYGSLLLGLFVFVLVKLFFQLGNGFIFNSKETIAEIVFKKFTYFSYSGIVMLLANLGLAFVLPGSKTIILVSILLILLINSIGWITALKNHQKFIASNFIYFILYLCALEIAPLIILGSYLLERSL